MKYLLSSSVAECATPCHNNPDGNVWYITPGVSFHTQPWAVRSVNVTVWVE